MTRRRPRAVGPRRAVLCITLLLLISAASLIPGRLPSALRNAGSRDALLGQELGPQGTTIPCPPRCAVIFNETGLPGDPVTWSVTLQNVTQSTDTGTIAFYNETNGTYKFVVGTVEGYAANPSSGTVVVKGANVTTWINFTQDKVLGLSPELGDSLLTAGAVALGLLGLLLGVWLNRTKVS